jgi:hypothetical protein
MGIVPMLPSGFQNAAIQTPPYINGIVKTPTVLRIRLREENQRSLISTKYALKRLTSFFGLLLRFIMSSKLYIYI